MIVDVFGGPGGWAEGLRMLGLDEIGVELDPWACATRSAAGHRVIRSDVATFPLGPLAGRVVGLIGSPPCPTFSAAGKGAGRAIIDELAAAVADALAGRPTLGARRRAMARKLREVALATGKATRAEASAQAWQDATQAALTVQPARWAAALKPRWIALEQVPAVLPLWVVYARHLRAIGYRTWAGILNSADYGVPQTRRRAILLASLDHPVGPPTPTHAQGGADTLFGSLAPWVSMAEALGWAGEDEPARTLAGHRSPRWLYPDADGTRGRMVGFPRRADTDDQVDGYRRRDFRTDNEPAATVTARHRSAVVLRAGAQQNATVRPVDQPAPTVLASWDNGDARWSLNRRQQTDGVPAPTLTGIAGAKSQWVWERPATTIAGDPRLSGPGRNDPDIPGSQYGENSVRLTLTEALILQSFRPDYPVRGTKTKQFEQVGNAVPPLLAAHVIAAVTGRALEAAA